MLHWYCKVTYNLGQFFFLKVTYNLGRREYYMEKSLGGHGPTHYHLVTANQYVTHVHGLIF